MRVLALVALSLLALGAVAQERFITTKGEAKVEVPPDFVEVSLTLLAVGPELQRLKEDVDSRTRQLLASAAELKVAGTDIESSGLRVTREYQQDRNDNESLRGYRVSRSVEIRLRAIDQYERLAQAMVDAKVDEIDGVDVGVDDRSALKQRALAEASRNASNEAQAVAAELGVKLGIPLEVSEERLFYLTALRERASDRFSEVVVTANLQSTPASVLVFQPRAIEVEATVWARFEILGAKSP
jgi:uncharacterized protein YggE